MISYLRPYPTYIPSGTPWLGEVPEHWEVTRLKAVGRIRYGLGQPPRESPTGLPLIRATNVNRGRIVEKDLLRIDPENVPIGRDAILREKEIIVVRSGAYTADSAIVPKHYAGSVAGYDMVLTVTKAIPEFIAAALLASYLRDDQLVLVSTRAAQPHLNAEELGTSVILIPPPEEQAAIVRFLDHADQRIRAYVSAKERLIALLEEERQALIHQAVTRGLDPNVRLKPSGVEWIGDVPEHWEVRRVKTLSKVKRGSSPRPIDDPKYFDLTGEYAWVRIADVTASNHYLEETTQKLSALGQSLSVRLEPGSLFLSIAGSVGKPIITRIKCCIHDGFVYFPDLKDNEEYLYQILSTPSPFFGLGKYGTQLNLNTDTVGGIQVAWPPLWERNHITEFLHDASLKFDEGVAGIRNQIDLMTGYRTRLIADVVTGQLDVREAAAQLPAAP